MAARPLRLMIYDRTCGRAGSWPGLSDTWRIGGALYRALGRFDAWTGVESWREALTWLATAGGDRTIGEIQYWGHGTWGRALIARDVLDASAVRPHHPLCAPLEQVRERLDRSGPSPALWWFRTCETFGREAGHDFARAWTGFFGCRAAGHTFVISALQSGLHSLGPGEAPRWSAREGLPSGVANPAKALPSRWGEVHTITCLRGDVPAGY